MAAVLDRRRTSELVLALDLSTVGDFNGDSKIDVVVGNVDGRNVSLLLGDGAGAFSPAPGSPLAFEGRVFAVNNADFNSDAKRDLVVD